MTSDLKTMFLWIGSQFKDISVFVESKPAVRHVYVSSRTHVGAPRGHEDGEVCEVTAGAVGGVAVDVHRLAAMSGPAALQAVCLVLPEGARCHIGFSVYGL